MAQSVAISPSGRLRVRDGDNDIVHYRASARPFTITRDVLASCACHPEPGWMARWQSVHDRVTVFRVEFALLPEHASMEIYISCPKREHDEFEAPIQCCVPCTSPGLPDTSVPRFGVMSPPPACQLSSLQPGLISQCPVGVRKCAT